MAIGWVDRNSRKVFLCRLLQKSVLYPSSRLLLMVESIVMHDREQSDLRMPSFTLRLAGQDKSMMSLSCLVGDVLG